MEEEQKCSQQQIDKLNTLTKSATKIVLLELSMIVSVLGLFAGIWGMVSRTLSPDKVWETFTVIVVAVFTYYFTNKGNQNLPYGGK